MKKGVKSFLSGTGIVSAPLAALFALRILGIHMPFYYFVGAGIFAAGWLLFLALGVVLVEIPKFRRRLRDHPIGLMGVDDDGLLYAPSGKAMFSVPMWLGARIQSVQHWVSGVSRKWAPPRLGVEVPGQDDGGAVRAQEPKPVKKFTRYQLALRRKNWLRRFFRF